MKLKAIAVWTAVAIALAGCDMPHVADFRDELQEKFEKTNGGVDDEATRVYVPVAAAVRL